MNRAACNTDICGKTGGQSYTFNWLIRKHYSGALKALYKLLPKDPKICSIISLKKEMITLCELTTHEKIILKMQQNHQTVPK
jgi:hypothetical protein